MTDEEFFHGYDPLLKRAISVRRIPSPILASPELRHRYLDAAQSWSRLNHPNILAVYDVQPEWMVTEGLSGQCLRDFLDLPRERRAFSRGLQSMLIPALLKGLGYAHEHGVVHGLLSPESIYLFPDDTLRIWDFGTALLEVEVRSTELPRKLYSIAPEQARGEKIDHRTDIWAIGVLLYSMSSGRLPFEADDLPFLIQKILLQEPAVPPEWNEGNISPGLREAILRCLSKRPEDRYQSVWDLETALFQRPAHAKPAAREGLMHHTRAKTYYVQGKFALARLEWEKAIHVDPYALAYVNNLGIACWLTGEIPRALDLLERAGSHFNLGLLRKQQGDCAGALDSLRKAIVLNPRFAASYLLLGECLLAEGKPWDAIEELQKSLILNPRSSRCLACLAMAHSQLGRIEEAESYKQKAADCEGVSADIEPLLQSPPGDS